ncbi:hypothetical protein [Desulfobacula sp.]|uniref:hypothetical protein n=1 Tax=Desulfobacula sp. TaxID=2593537 RepID=UPI002627C774|nr:hypothetical protein [Desulfobacula sp.]
MKSSTKSLFVIVLIVMSFVAVPAVFAQERNTYNQNDDAGQPDFYDPCVNILEGCVTATAYRTIVLDYTNAFKTPITFPMPDVDEKISVKYWVNPDGVKVACNWYFIEYCVD